MRVPRRSAALLAARARRGGRARRDRRRARPWTRRRRPAPVSWRGLVGEPRAAVPNGQRMIVVLNAPSVGAAAREGAVRDRGAGALVDVAGARRTAAGADDARGAGRRASGPTSATRACSTASRRRSTAARVALLDQMNEVAGVYPVRAAFPASVSETLLAPKAFGPSSGHRPAPSCPGFDGRGVTIALLDTGVDQAHPYLRGKILPGIDLVDENDDATRAGRPAGSVADRTARHRARGHPRRRGRPAAACTASHPARRCSRFASPAGSRTPTARISSTAAATS